MLSYRAMLVAIVSQNSCALVFMGYRDKLQHGVSHRCACVKLTTKGGGVIAPFSGAAEITSLKHRGFAEGVGRKGFP